VTYLQNVTISHTTMKQNIVHEVTGIEFQNVTISHIILKQNILYGTACDTDAEHH